MFIAIPDIQLGRLNVHMYHLFLSVLPHFTYVRFIAASCLPAIC